MQTNKNSELRIFKHCDEALIENPNFFYRCLKAFNFGVKFNLFLAQQIGLSFDLVLIIEQNHSLKNVLSF